MVGKVIEERRKFPRLNAKLLVKYRVLEKGKKRKESESKDIGGGGIKLFLNERLLKDTPLELEINIPGEGKPIVAEGRVVWSKEVGCGSGEELGEWFDTGIMFTKIEPLEQCRILKYVYSHIY